VLVKTGLREDEVHILHGVLDLRYKTAQQAMTSAERVVMIGRAPYKFFEQYPLTS
jgi:CBS domain containing-hemolysin-like protein